MSTLNIVFGILVLVMSLFLVITILLQSSKDHRMSGTIAGGAETFFGKQKGKTMDGILNKVTAVVCVVFFVAVVLMYILQPNNDVSNISGDYDNIISIDENGNIVDNGTSDAETEGEAEAETEGEAEGEAEAETDSETDAEAETDNSEEAAE